MAGLFGTGPSATAAKETPNDYMTGAIAKGLLSLGIQPNERDAYWISLAETADDPAYARALGYVRGEKSRFGFPRPGDLCDDPAATVITPEMREWYLRRKAEMGGDP